MQLDAHTVELELHVGATTEFFQKAGHIRQAFGQLRPNRSADDHLQATDAIQPFAPQRFAQHAKVGGLVVRIFKRQLLGLGAAQAGLIQRREDRCVADTEAAGAQGNAHQVFCRNRVESSEELRQSGHFAFGAAGAAQVGQRTQLGEDIVH